LSTVREGVIEVGTKSPLEGKTVLEGKKKLKKEIARK